MTNPVRGSTLYFVVVFRDKDGAVAAPSGATLRIGYYVNSVWKIDTIAMTAEGDGWSASWNSLPADAGNVFWWAMSAGSPSAATEGTIKLEANGAALQS